MDAIQVRAKRGLESEGFVWLAQVDDKGDDTVAFEFSPEVAGRVGRMLIEAAVEAGGGPAGGRKVEGGHRVHVRQERSP
jgi:hypothetical protein